jgi:hypothetical protein
MNQSHFLESSEIAGMSIEKKGFRRRAGTPDQTRPVRSIFVELFEPTSRLDGV